MNGLQRSFVGNNELVKPVGGSVIALTSYRSDAGFEEWHAHENASISLLLAGNYHEDLAGGHYKRMPGDLKFIPAGEMHRCNTYAPGTRKINLDLDAHLLKRMDISPDRLSAFVPNSLPAKFTLIKLYHELDDSGSHAVASSDLLLYELFFNPAKGNPIKTNRPAPLWASRLKELLNDEWDRPFHLDDLSARLGVHPVTISRYFPIYFSATLGSYINQIKISKALALIKATSIPLTEIAYTCGFADHAHFTRTFKSVTGYLPREFRKL